jgi:hypothetical protein
VLERLYGQLRSVRADLVDACGASDLCIVEGDSVVAEAFRDSSLDWTSGGQFLHLTFIVEKYLLVRCCCWPFTPASLSRLVR